MTIFQAIETGSIDAVSAPIAALETDMDRGVRHPISDHDVAAEEADFCWNARVEERPLGPHQSVDEEEFDLDCVEIIGCLDGLWFIAICLVDGEGHTHAMVSRRTFARATEAREAWAR